MKKIIVHNGMFHADDVMAIAILRQIFGATEVPIMRTNEVAQEDLNDPDVFVVDVGRQYVPSLNNYDHHQDDSLPSACMLVMLAHPDAGDYPYIIHNLLSPISNCDKGINSPRAGTLNSVLRPFNTIPDGFTRAIHLCEEILDVYRINSSTIPESERIWDAAEKRGKFAILNELIFGWRPFAMRDGIQYILCPSMRGKGQWNIVSRDSHLFTIPPDEKQLFLHSSGFIASYENYEDALSVIENL